MAKVKVLVMDDNAVPRSELCRLFAHMGFTADGAPGGMQGMARANGDSYDLVFLDATQTGQNSIALLREIRRQHPDTQVILLTSIKPVDVSVEAMRHGAFDCVCKPLNLEEVRMVAERALEMRRVLEENKRLRNLVEEKYEACPLRDVERDHIHRVLEHVGWNQTQAAKVLEIDRKTLRSKMNEFKVRKPQL